MDNMYRRFRPILLVSIIGLLAIIGLMPASSFGGDGNLTYQETPPGDEEICGNNKDDDGDGQVDESPPCPAPSEPTCFNDNDDNNYDGADTDDLGCVRPIEPEITPQVLDNVEGNIWDTDLSQTFGGPKSKGIMFSGEPTPLSSR